MIEEEISDIDAIIRQLATIDSYKGAESLLFTIEKYPGELDEEQLKIICFASMTNEQIYESYICKTPLKIILEKNRDKINDKLLNKVREKIN